MNVDSVNLNWELWIFLILIIQSHLLSLNIEINIRGEKFCKRTVKSVGKWQRTEQFTHNKQQGMFMEGEEYVSKFSFQGKQHNLKEKFKIPNF